MKIPTFFRFLNKKIEEYDKLATNPFTSPQSITIIWIDDNETPNIPFQDQSQTSMN